jgi:sugar phosphate isomerase/epimerase
MKLGLFTAAFPELKLEEIAKWAAENAFESLEIACWPYEKAGRRYAGVTHIDVDELNPQKAKEIRTMLKSYGLEISSLGYYPNPLQADLQKRNAEIEHLKKVIMAAELLDVSSVGTFIGSDKTKNDDQNLAEYARVWPSIVKFAKEHGRKIGIENCPMFFSYDEWPNGSNLAHTPYLWRKMWEIIPDDNFGLNLDPSHLILQMIDIERVVREFKDRIFHVHAKDLMIDWEGIYQHGVFSKGMGWQVPRLPGLGDVKWDRFIGALYAAGYDSYISIEHEDRTFEGTEARVKQGFLIARDVLRPYIH